MKSSRFFLLHSFENYNNSLAILDTHILKFIRENIDHRAPKSTPTITVTYKYWEDVFLYWCELNKKNVAEFDLEIWKSYARTAKS
jgi:thermostable 8-oxoguanine DNA glycosylase